MTLTVDRTAVEQGADVADAAAREFLVVGARSLAHGAGLGGSLDPLLRAVADWLQAASAVIMTVEEGSGRLDIAASIGLTDPVAEGLLSAATSPAHPIARTVATGVPSFDVSPTAPGGPALRSHLPLIVTRSGRDMVLGVLALAHERPIDPAMQPLVQAAAELAAVMIERHRRA